MVGCTKPVTPFIDTLRIDTARTESTDVGTILEVSGRFTGGVSMTLCDAPVLDLQLRQDALADWVSATDAVFRRLYVEARGMVSDLTPGTTCDLRLLLDGRPVSTSDAATPARVTIDPKAPGAPTNITVTDEDGAARITFEPPWSGGSPILHYEIQLEEDGPYETVSASDTNPTFTLTNLDNGTTYQARLRATNAAGTGPASAPFPLAPFTTPDAPEAVSVTDEDGAARITFEPPWNGGSPILHYEIQLEEDGPYETVSASDTNPTFTLTNLDNGTTYEARLRATNVAGTGPASDPFPLAPFTTPDAPENLSATPTPDSVTVTFAPGFDGGRAVTGFERKLNDGSWVALDPVVESGSFTVDGLAQCTEYTLSVRARNDAGVGPTASVNAKTTGTQPTRFTKVEAGFYHALALDNCGTLWSWGYNGEGQLGFATGGASVDTPSSVDAPAFTTLAVGNQFSVALDADGFLWTWGSDELGQLGNGDASGVSVAVPTLIMDHAFSAVDAGLNFAVALDTEGHLFTWGNDSQGQLGNGSASADVTAPTRIADGMTFKAIAAGSYHVLAVETDGTLWTWGRNSFGEVGNGTEQKVTAPVSITGDTYVSVVAGSFHSLALRDDGTWFGWGQGYYGQLGNGGSGSGNFRLTTPQELSWGPFEMVTAGKYASLALDAEGGLWTWGRDDNEQLGNGDGTADVLNPTKITGVTFEQVSAGSEFAAALTSEGELWTWGHDGNGQLGNGSTSTADVKVPTRISDPW